MIHRKWILGLSVFAISIACDHALGDILYSISPELGSSLGTGLGSNGPVNVPIEGAKAQQIAERVQLSSDAIATQLDWYGNYIDSSIPVDPVQFVVRFHNDVTGVPGAIIAEQSVSAIGMDTGYVDGLARPILLYHAELADQPLAADTTQWISILENDVLTPITWAWHGALPSNITIPGFPLPVGTYAFRYGPDEIWQTAGLPANSRAYTLHGVAVPEPTTLAFWLEFAFLFAIRKSRSY